MAVILRITRCDNRLECRLNGKMVWNKYYDYDNDLKDQFVDLTDKLEDAPETNTLTFRGFNGPPVPNSPPNPWHFAYTVEQNGTILHSVDQRSTPGSPFNTGNDGANAWPWEDEYVIPNWPVNS